MGQVVHIGYHNCRNRGSYEDIRQGVPFLSGPDENQWLTQGFYLWTDSPHYAMSWNGGRNVVVSEFEVTFESRDELLDLVGNARDIFEFEEMVDRAIKVLHGGDATKITVNQVISYFRELENDAEYAGIFPYHAVKAQDKSNTSSGEVVVRFVRTRRERLVALTRQQMCVFENARDKITFKSFVAPDEFAQRQG
ncbi:hypothetical protein ABSL19_002009 [Escherichia coli]|uniref:hypothetical protein n=1 Tax=Citrobacter TaxID=544 RepID=UPI0015EA388F|nr:hypothetical protein [Citrobacter sp. Cpo040]EIX1603174.1 hypothetical protein [Escherichia coli]MBA8419020.1 hypothetical protein [Citrobacter freundii]MDM2878429.1 hypothetical protein [Citrobacter sp. Cpo040]QMM95898.1 hypothetical protein HVW92_16580 [Citrobacter freundii]